MIRQSYSDFVFFFGYLNPYELDHLSDALYVKFEETLLGDDGSKKLPFSQQDVKQVLTKAMRDIQIELAETRMDEAKIHLQRAKTQTFAPNKVTDNEVALITQKKRFPNKSEIA